MEYSEMLKKFNIKEMNENFYGKIKDIIEFNKYMMENEDIEDYIIDDIKDLIERLKEENQEDIAMVYEHPMGGLFYKIYDRICSECGEPMDEGYCIENGMEYYCSDECLHKHYTEKEWLEMYDNGNSDSYWTQWED